MAKKIKHRKNFTIAWICIKKHELAAAAAMLDEEYALAEEQDAHDHNTYVLGRVKKHDIVIICPPAGMYGKRALAKDILRWFPSLQFGVLIGVGSGLPGNMDIRLGDVVVGTPNGQHGGVVLYDMNKPLKRGGFDTRGYPNKPPRKILTAVQTLRTIQETRGSQTQARIAQMFERNPGMRPAFGYPGPDQDHLYESQCQHGKISCDKCIVFREIKRMPRLTRDGRLDSSPRLFHGLIGSGDRAIASQQERDRVRTNADMLCFEAEGAGLVDFFPSVAVRGISDYADGRESNKWQQYAAVAAAAYAKELLQLIPPA